MSAIQFGVCASLTLGISISIALFVDADVLYLKDGNQYNGTVIAQDKDKVTFRIGDDEGDGIDITFFTDEIKRIDETEAEEGILVSLPQGVEATFSRPSMKDKPFVTKPHEFPDDKALNQTESESGNLQRAAQQVFSAMNMTHTVTSAFPTMNQGAIVPPLTAPAQASIVLPPAASAVSARERSADALPPSSWRAGDDVTAQPQTHEAHKNVSSRAVQTWVTHQQKLLLELMQYSSAQEREYLESMQGYMQQHLLGVLPLISRLASMSGETMPAAGFISDEEQRIEDDIRKLKNTAHPVDFSKIHMRFLDLLSHAASLVHAASSGATEDAQQLLQLSREPHEKFIAALEDAIAKKQKQKQKQKQ